MSVSRTVHVLALAIVHPSTLVTVGVEPEPSGSWVMYAIVPAEFSAGPVIA